MQPVPGTKLWKKSDLPKPLPPGERKLPGRPRKRRIRHPLEYDHEISRVGRKDKMDLTLQWREANIREDPLMPPSSSSNKRKEPPIKTKSSQVNEASGSKNNLTPEAVNPAEQTHVIAFASSAHVDQFPETSQDLSTEKAGSSAPVDQFPKTSQDPKRRQTKEKRKQI
nr:hypothetical protein [Tanacetum cinerariifolium]